MATQVNNPGMAVVAGAALVARRLVKADGTYCGADATQDWLGVTQENRASGEPTPVRFLGAGTVILTAAVAITPAGSLVYKAANGKIGVTNTNALIGIALETASGDGIEIQVKPLVS
jgi:hypothetical protein